MNLHDGRSVLDFGSYPVTLLGNNHRIVAAVREQLGQMTSRPFAITFGDRWPAAEYY